MKYITFDIEDWFHILDFEETARPSSWRNFKSRIDYGTSKILELLDKHDQKGTFFCLGWIAENYPNIIKQINDAGHHIGTHSHNHQLVYNQSPSQFKQDLTKSINLLSDLTGKEINAYRAPGFSINKNSLWALDILAEEGIKYDSSIFPANRLHGGLPNFKTDNPCIIETLKGYEIIELPINTNSFLGRRFVYSGGGYFRLLPKWYLKRAFKDDNYVMTYFHPRDFDFYQPRLNNLSLIRKFKCYVGIKGAYNKLDEILAEHEFKSLINIEESLERISIL